MTLRFNRWLAERSTNRCCGQLCWFIGGWETGWFEGGLESEGMFLIFFSVGNRGMNSEWDMICFF